MSRILLVLTLLSGCSGSSTAPPGDHSSQQANSPASATEKELQLPEVPQPDVQLQQSDCFEDVTKQCGVNFAYRNGQESGQRYILESLGGGVAMFDYDVDGDLDLYFTGGGNISKDPVQITGRASALYRNDGNWKFCDVTRETGLAEPLDYSHGMAVSDFNRDGYPDLFVCCYGTSRLYRNIDGREFVDVTESSGIDATGWCTAAAWTDIDTDGWPDLVAIRYLNWSPQVHQECFNADGKQEVCGPGRFEGASDLLFRNRGDGSFEEISESSGFFGRGKGLGVVVADLNLDGWIDYYVANDKTENHLYFGQSDGSLREDAFAAGAAVNEYGMPDGSMGVDVGDVNSDGYPDIWVTNFEGDDNALYQNLGQSSFTHATSRMALSGQSRRQVGFGTALADFDGDGWLDIFVANGHVFYHGGELPYHQQPQLFQNLHRSQFSNVSETGGTYFRSQHCARGAAVGDLDNDGGLDLVIVHQNDPVAVLRNRFPMKHFIRFRLTGETTTRESIGATVTLLTSDRKIIRSVSSGSGYFSHFDQRILLPVEDEKSVDVAVMWPGGQQETFSKLAPGITHQLVQGRGIPRETE
jgi:hypothetical protein